MGKSISILRQNNNNKKLAQFTILIIKKGERSIAAVQTMSSIYVVPFKKEVTPSDEGSWC